MSSIRHTIAQIVHDLDPVDELERKHQVVASGWIASGAELCRVTPPDNPPMHLVSYFVPFDRATASVLVAAHRKSGLDLPPGGHCEPGESPWQTVERECREELGVPAIPANLRPVADLHPNPDLRPTPDPTNPLFLTVTETRGTIGRHTDVSLWHVLDLPATTPLLPDPREFADVRWLTLDALLAEPVTRFDPHMHRFARKLRAAAG